jgi:hypothetical protein
MNSRRHDARFYELLDLARAGDEPALHELWIVYRHDYARDGDPRDSDSTQPMSETNNKHQKEK